MPFSTFRGAACAAVIALAPTMASAEEVFGTITASLDGVERTWFLTSNDDESQSFGMTMEMANLQSFSLWGQPSAEGVKTFDDTLLLSFDVMSVGGQTIPLNVSLTYLADGWKAGWLADEEGGMVFSLNALETSDQGVLVEGEFDATANYSEALAEGVVDASRTMRIDGGFSATLPAFLIEER